MARVMMLAPFLLGLSYWLRRTPAPAPAKAPAAAHDASRVDNAMRVHVPWFAFGFIAMVLVHSSGILSPRAVQFGTAADSVLLAIAMSALGLTTQVNAVRRAGQRPLILAGALFAWLTIGGALINAAVQSLTR